MNIEGFRHRSTKEIIAARIAKSGASLRVMLWNDRTTTPWLLDLTDLVPVIECAYPDGIAVSDVAACVIRALAQVSRPTDFGPESAGHTLGDLTGARVFGAVVLRASDHRFLVLTRTRRVFLRSDVIFRARLRVDIAEYTGLHAIVFSHH